MARGWESKDVEAQRLDSRPTTTATGGAPSPEQRQREQQRRGLELSRTRVLRQLEETDAPVRRQSLEAALRHLEAEIAKLSQP